MLDPKNIHEEREKLLKAGQMHLVHWLIVVLSIVITLIAWYYSKSQLNQKLEAKFERNAEQVVNLVKERMKLYENALWSGVAYIDSVETEITQPRWALYANSLKIDLTYPGINGIGIIYNIKPDQLNSYLDEQRQYRPNYKIHPNHTESEYWPITYIEPVAPNKMAVGLDMAFETNRYSSVKKARDTGEAQLTGPITLVQDAKKTPGFLFYTPFYKNGSKPKSIDERRDLIEGVVYAPFIMKNLMQGTLAEKNRQVSIKITDSGDILYDDKDNKSLTDFDNTPLFTKQIDIKLNGRVWSFSIQSNLSFRNESTANQSSYILIGGLFIDSMLLGLFLFLSRANRLALDYADRINSSLETKTKHLEKSNKDLEQFSYVASHDLKSPLNAIKQLVGWVREDCIDIIPEESKNHLDILTQRSDRMMKLLNDLLDYSRINRTEFKSISINLKEMTKDLDKLLDIPSGFNIIAPDINITIPEVPFEIVLRNLLSNSIKHHDKENGTIIISYEQGNDFHIITVEDDGPGIPEEFHEKAMEMFQTLKPRDKVEGSGMGLSMIKKIVTHYQGSVMIHSDGKRGTRILIFWKKN
ncbi:CHASE domain-containing protein [Pseudocolwellia sp. AS88]|uniref:CHASE domain-containing protein n=1 Tax=Pseudocolwellia sp. AS88 TaxID=3063958 RepID=UPI0026EFBABC|nr:CHASE domain-containing protein [Pseudocolwellia sp. AS88]MDO7083380.1 CHASE domain-containing protein [Pseudocolwellia sp. AS88]